MRTLLFIYILFVTVVVKIFLADASYKNARNFYRYGEISNALEEINKAIAKNPNEPRYYKERAKILFVSSEASAVADLETAHRMNPRNLVVLRDSIPIYALLTEYPEKTAAAFKFLQGYLPNDVGVAVLLAKYEKNLGLGELYKASLGRIRFLRPDLLEWYSDLVTQ